MNTLGDRTPVARSARVPAGRALATLYRILLRAQTSRGRLLGLAALALLPIVVAVVARQGGMGEAAIVAMLAQYGVGVFIPLAALLFAAPLFTTLAESRLLVYLWLKPIRRWYLPVAALAALVTVVAPVAIGSLAATALIGDQMRLVGVAALAALVATLAYGAVYLMLGARFSWGIWLGLAYLLVWENLFGGISSLGRASIRSYAFTIISWRTEVHVPLADRGDWAAIFVPIVIAVIATALTARILSRRDVE